MALNRDKFRGIVSGITTPPAKPLPAEPSLPEPTEQQATIEPPAVSDSPDVAEPSARQSRGVPQATKPEAAPARFAQRGRPKASPERQTKGKKAKASLWLDEEIINDVYEWAYQDRMGPGDFLDAILRPWHEKEKKRRNAGKA